MRENRRGVLPDLLAQIPMQERIGSVTADGICDTKGVSRSHRGTRCRCHHTPATKCQGLEGPRSRPAGAKRSAACLQAVRPGQLEEMVRVSQTQLRGGQDDLAGSLEPMVLTCSTSSS